MKKRIQLQGFLIFATVIVTVFFMIVMPKVLFVQWQDENADVLTDILGVIFICLGYLIRLTARNYKSAQSSNSQKLVADGIYTYVRNPMYLGSFLIGAGVVIIVFQFWVLFILGFVFALIYQSQTKMEEKVLLEKFNQEYSQYRSATPKYFPIKIFSFLKYLFTEAPFQWKSIRSERSSFFSIVLTVLLIEAWQDARLFVNHEFVTELLKNSFIFICVVIFMFAINKMATEKSK